ncbi:MAG: flagellar export chaperone FliS [Gemmatimonadales bacterium]|nr:flagellar export chaperone FliS [Gemmatimonadales bacterium]
MYSNIGIQRYKEADIHSMTKEKMILLLYEKVESDLNAAVTALAQNDIVEMTRMVNHSQRIICELRGALDHNIGGDISQNLEILYDYMFQEHLQVIISRDTIHLEHCLRVLQPLLDSWRKIPAGTGEQAARDNSRGLLNGQESGPETAPEDQENLEDDKAVPDRTMGMALEPQGKISLSG